MWLDLAFHGLVLFMVWNLNHRLITFERLALKTADVVVKDHETRRRPADG